MATITWPQYLTRGAFNTGNNNIIYHLCELDSYQEQLPLGNYIPPTFHVDGGFIHATEVRSQLLAVANHFYQSSGKKWICLSVDPRFLGCAVIYEAAAGVGDIEPMPWTKKEDKFPHIYGKIPLLAISKIYNVIRNEKGEFLRIEGL